jgi:hypothetical protein
MRPLFSLSFLLVIGWSSVAAAEPDGPNRLTSKDVTDGWILLFDGETTFGFVDKDPPRWTVADGALTPKAESQSPLVSTTVWDRYQLEFEYRLEKDASAEVRIGCDREGETRKGAAVSLPLSGTGWQKAELDVDRTALRSTLSGPAGGAAGSRSLDLDGAGHVAFAGKGVAFRSIKLKPKGLESVFNGKDLSGWKEFPGKKSKFSVTREGWLNLKDGPGDLQTEGQWDDFVLQLDCYSNGDHLNSGVFFRCRPGEYQMGYEAQIRNEFHKSADVEYTLEDYDPTTNHLIGKRKARFTAVDYGTGAIYRRVPARREVARDREWFTLTVVARGRHLATWVNGIPVVDWTDNRPLADNARNGCHLDKGPISLQGHDPTTDLNFRHLRIADLPKPARAP